MRFPKDAPERKVIGTIYKYESPKPRGRPVALDMVKLKGVRRKFKEIIYKGDE